MTKRKCFGTDEFVENSNTCNGCSWYIKCKETFPKEKIKRDNKRKNHSPSKTISFKKFLEGLNYDNRDGKEIK